MNTLAVEYSGAFAPTAVLPIADIASRTFEGLERLAQLNIQTLKESLVEQREIAEEAVTARSFERMVALPSAQSQAVLKKGLAYWQEASNIAIETAADNVGYGWGTLNDYSRWAATLFGDPATMMPGPASTELVVVDPDATLPSALEAAPPLAKQTGMGRGTNIVDPEGNSLSRKKQ
ncbi:phasin family protein [Trinickia caryophylli]|uniref:Phasin family protein n=1 Tax=Trinickia caryophylli TaxID=28094 RepID=A0A1X7CDQ9_TRICW|nr:phasin family protein [Trinickia caryophylli]PMS12562.1 hypothetical protein C0Z17_09290 [Trinickia caryophylli]TRX19766.1 phasin family protein [Trinickia caryophylli]WQE12912.1 phasin family protein [Trinickia caryophylli]SME94914.1 phasin family protein [Trinickia caryophylli]GLU30637.1 hypothetical protein Busp01_04790 [Trinickia caryophylli]